MRKIDALLQEYGASHQNKTNKKIHWICVPLIFFSVVGLIFSIPADVLNKIAGQDMGAAANWASIVLLFVLIYYFRLSPPLGFGMVIISIVFLTLAHFLSQWPVLPLWATCLIIFTLAWIGQFYGHKVEGKKPSFFKDLQFLLIGPAWLMHFIYKKLHIKY